VAKSKKTPKAAARRTTNSARKKTTSKLRDLAPKPASTRMIAGGRRVYFST
jgi:hypothetical protein